MSAGLGALRNRSRPTHRADALFGAAAEKAQGHVVTTILIGMVAMQFTAISYGRMANAYPSAGSAYACVSREIQPAPGYITGWRKTEPD